MSTTSSARSRAWCFTINNPGLADAVRIANIECRYVIYGNEYGELGTNHYQGYIYFENARSFSAVRKLLGDRAHIEKARGTPAENKAYCSKDGHVVERGICPSPGARTDLAVMREQMDAGESLKVVVRGCTSYQAMRGAELMYKYRDVDVSITRNVRVIWFWGQSGVGKTYRAVQEVTERKLNKDCWISSKSLEWFDGYGGQKAVILDDVNWKLVTDFKWLLRLLDKYQLRVPIKGSFVDWTPELIYVTSIQSPADLGNLFPHEPIAQLTRRIHEIIELTEVYH